MAALYSSCWGPWPWGCFVHWLFNVRSFTRDFVCLLNAELVLDCKCPKGEKHSFLSNCLIRLPSPVLEDWIQDLAQEPHQWPTSSVSFSYLNFYHFLGVDSTKVNVGNKLKRGLGFGGATMCAWDVRKMEETESKYSNPQLPASVILEKPATMRSLHWW